MTSTIGRLAPSPTGGLHLGHARTFLIAWLAARGLDGKVVLRVEDLDAGRARAEAIDGAIADLQWLGLDWDEGPFLQSHRFDLYGQALDRLKAAELVYPCTCTRADIGRAASAPHLGEEGPIYPGTCAGKTASDAAKLGDRPYAWRFRVPPGPIAWDDLVRGEAAIDPSLVVGDFVVARSPAPPSYQLAVVVDDAAMGISHVIRGDDLLSSTPRQLLLYRALGSEAPRFGHVPLAIGPDGRRLAKRDGSLRLSSLRQAGADPGRLIGWIAASCGWADRVEPSRPSDWVDRFDLKALPPDPWIVTSEAVAELISSGA